jgi:hypothetical protein
MLFDQVGLAGRLLCVEYLAVLYVPAIYRRKLINFEHQVAKDRHYPIDRPPTCPPVPPALTNVLYAVRIGPR